MRGIYFINTFYTLPRLHSRRLKARRILNNLTPKNLQFTEMTTNSIEINNDYEYFDDDTPSINKAIDYITSSSSYDEYFSKYLRKNKPCVMKFVTDSWPCRRKWVAANDAAPNFEYLKKEFGVCVAPVADCTTKYYNSQMKDDMTLNDFIDYWISRRENPNSDNNSLLYLKDWHCIKENPNIPIYEVPSYFASDWLNEYYTENDELNDDYMFVYMGPKGSWTPFHADVFSSYSWSANIVGKKRWLLFKPGDENGLRNKYGQLIYDVDSEELKDKTIYPNYNEKTLESYEIVQEPGEIVFVPSGWHHQVWNLEDTISINHNWINACNIWNVWISLKKELLAVMKEVEDCRDMDGWENHCQVMLRASHGMNYIQFYNFLSFLALKRIASIERNIPVISFGRWYLGRNHCFYDLKEIRLVLDDMMNDTEEKCIDSIIFCEKDPKLLVQKINELF